MPTFDTATGHRKTADVFWTPPNLVSIARILPIPLIYWSFKHAFDYLTLALLGGAFLTDAIDGYLARRFRWGSRWGLILDPLADKVLIGCLTIFLVIFRGFPVWMASLIIFRDIAIVVVGIYLYFKPYHIVVPSNVTGKVTTLVTSCMLLLYTLDFQPYGQWCLWAALLCIIGSGIHYTWVFLRLLERPSVPSSGSPLKPSSISKMNAYQRSRGTGI
jgi:CDP-diacylglycerol--glycerol-3-phosphate 3-phosphatidyltransferase